MTDKQLTITMRQLTGLLVSLTIAYILGVILTTVVNYDPSKHSTLQSTFLIAHIVVALGVLIGAIIRFVLSLRWKSLRVLSGIGHVSVVGCFGSGDEASKNGSNIAVLFMALFFIIAVICYDICFLKLNSHTSNK